MISGCEHLVDLTHFIEEGMPVYPGTESPSLVEANTLEKDGFREKLISMYSHTGTHMDAPAHVIRGAPVLDVLPLDKFFGPALMIDVSAGSGKPITREDLEKHEDTMEMARWLILRTGWSRYWGEGSYFEGYPVLDADAAGWLTGKDLNGLGLDCISADPAGEEALPIHHILLGSGLLIVENLILPEHLPESFYFSCFPLRIREADGSPVRAMAHLG